MHLRGGRYETIGKIASGGMATVLLARTVSVGGFERLVALKAMHEHLKDEPDFVAMFLDKARLAARIHHPNVVSTLDVDEDEHGIFLVMEYIEGPALNAVQRALRKEDRRLPQDVMLRVFIDALTGLHAAHELQGADGQPLRLVHRDVSPHNILVGVDGIARLTDFGVARAETRLSSTVAGQIKGKVAFMAPEQLDQRAVDRRADVYSAGVVLWELLTCRRMMTAENDGSLINDVLHGTRRSPRELCPDIPPVLEAACMRALQRSPDDRFSTAAAFAEAIESAGLPIASARGVAAFVAELGVHRAAPNLAPSSVASGRPSRSGGTGDRPSALSAGSSRDARMAPSINSTATAERTEPEAGEARPVGARGRGRAAVTAGLGVAVLLAAGLFVGLRMVGRSSPGVAVPAAAAPPESPLTAAPSAAPPLSPVPAAPPVVSSNTPAGEPPALVKLHGSRPARAAVSTSRPEGKQPPVSSTSWRPADL